MLASRLRNFETRGPFNLSAINENWKGVNSKSIQGRGNQNGGNLEMRYGPPEHLHHTSTLLTDWKVKPSRVVVT